MIFDVQKRYEQTDTQTDRQTDKKLNPSPAKIGVVTEDLGRVLAPLKRLGSVA